MRLANSNEKFSHFKLTNYAKAKGSINKIIVFIRTY